jgi:hypothetical protein
MAKQGASARACKLVQLYARLLETDENGYGKCCSCGEVFGWDFLHGGHFQPKGRHYNAASYEEDNVHIQCATCNTYRGGNPAGYSKFMLDNYGEDVIEYLKLESYKTPETEEVREIARIYKQKCKDLVNDKNFQVRIPT